MRLLFGFQFTAWIYYYGLVAMQVNDAVLAGDNTLVSCSSDATLKVC